MKFFDRLLTIVITATLTSAVWIVFGTTIMEAAEDKKAPDIEAQPSPTVEPSAPPTIEELDEVEPIATPNRVAPPVPTSAPSPVLPGPMINKTPDPDSRGRTSPVQRNKVPKADTWQADVAPTAEAGKGGGTG